MPASVFPGAGQAAGSAPRLIGRDRDLSQLGELVDNVGVRGGALVIRGEPGVGKTALLTAAVARAGAKGLTVRRAVGVQSEAQLAFAGLHQLLQPFLGSLKGLPVPQRRALESALGMTEGDAPDIFLIGLATLGLLAEAAEDAPSARGA
jgi:AAA ATPase domain